MSRSREVQEAVGLEGETLEQKRARLRAVVQEPSARELAVRELMEVESEIAAKQQAGLTAEVEARLVAIKRALGSLVDQSTMDPHRLLDAARKFADAVEVLNERFEKCLMYRHEAQALAEVFGLPVPELSPVIVPTKRAEVQEAFESTCRVGVRDHGYVRPQTDNDGHRTFEELAGTPGCELIKRKLNR